MMMMMRGKGRGGREKGEQKEQKINGTLRKRTRVQRIGIDKEKEENEGGEKKQEKRKKERQI